MMFYVSHSLTFGSFDGSARQCVAPEWSVYGGLDAITLPLPNSMRRLKASARPFEVCKMQQKPLKAPSRSPL